MTFAQALTRDQLRRLCGKTSTGLDSNAALYIGASTTTPTETGGNVTEPVGNGYARLQMDPADWDEPTDASPSELLNATEELMATASGGAWGLLTYNVVYDALTAGNFLGSGLIAGGGKQIDDGDTPRFAAGTLAVTLT